MTRHIVRRRNWRWAPGNEHTPRGWVCFPGPGPAVAEFDFFDDAEHDWGKREAAVRLKMNPFECGPLPALTSLPEPIFRDFLMDTGIAPPAAGTPWDAWWTATRDELSDEQRARVWEAVGKVRFFEITEEAAGPEVHVVVDVQWEERDGVHVAEWDGGHLIRACRHSQRAGEIARGRANQERIVRAGSHNENGPFADCRPCNVPDPLTPGSTRLVGLSRASFSEVFTIPFEDKSEDVTMLPRGDEVCVVVRHDYSPRADFAWDNPEGRRVGVPVRAFIDWEQAVSFVQELLIEAGAWFNPFRLVTKPEHMSLDRTLYRLSKIVRAMGVPNPHDTGWDRWWADQVVAQPSDKHVQLWRELALQFYSVLTVPFEASP